MTFVKITKLFPPYVSGSLYRINNNIYNFRSGKSPVEPRYNEGERNKENKRSLYRGFVVSRIVFIYFTMGKTYLAISYTVTLLFKFFKD